MTATYTAERRRSSPTPPRPLRELPVLFHLMDVSRPKGYTTSAPPAFTLGSPADEAGPHRQSPLASRLPSEPPIEGAQSFDLETASELVQTKAYGSLPSDSPHLVIQPEGSIAEAGKSLEHASGDATGASALETPPPAGDDAVTLRQRAEERHRKRQEGKKDDWFRTQGRFIVIGFLAALVVTIYVARSGRKPAPPPVAKSPAGGTAAKVAKAIAAKQTAAAETAKITSVTPKTKPAASQPTTALHPPTIPQLATQAEPAKAPADETLFTFTRRTDERVAASNPTPAASTTAAPTAAATAAPAAAPEVNHSTVPPLVPQPAWQCVPQAAAAPAPATPHLQPHYPATSYPSTYQPVAPPPAYAPPAYAPPPASPGGPNLGPAASTMPLYPTTNTASGTRYERTGSGLY